MEVRGIAHQLLNNCPEGKCDAHKDLILKAYFAHLKFSLILAD